MIHEDPLARSDEGRTDLELPRALPQSDSRWKWIRYALVGVIGILVTAVVLSLPYWATGFWVRVVTSMFMFAILAESWNIITGFVGYPAFGNTVFFGLGAYIVALSTKAGMPVPAAILLSGAAAIGMCLLIGNPLMRLRGHYFAIATMALSLGMMEIASNIPVITGGSSGIVLPIPDGTPRDIFAQYYFLMLLILVACVATTYWVAHSRFGYGLRTIKTDETVATTLGIPTTRYKVAAWSLSAFFTAMAGGVWALWITFIDPESAFSLDIAVEFSVMALLGGLGTVFGPVIAAFIVEYISVVVWQSFLTLHLAVQGLIIMVIVLVAPNGFMELVRSKAVRSRLRTTMERLEMFRMQLFSRGQR